MTYPKTNAFCTDLKKSDDTNTNTPTPVTTEQVPVTTEEAPVTTEEAPNRRKRQAEFTEGTAIVTDDENVLNQPTALIIFQNVDKYVLIFLIIEMRQDEVCPALKFSSGT